MDVDARLPDSQKTGLTDVSGSSSSSASSRYGLDERDESPVLVYDYQGDVDIMSQKALAQKVNRASLKRKGSRVTRKHIPRGTSVLDIYGGDLCLDEEKEDWKRRAAYWVNVASVPIPRLAYWSRLFLGNYDELYIVSPESSPASSEYDGDSRKVSPSSTWEYGSQEVAPGADA